MSNQYDRNYGGINKDTAYDADGTANQGNFGGINKDQAQD